MTRAPLLIAHRGASARHRENAPAAWLGAMEDGADAIEADIRMTADHRLVICHDPDLSRLAGVPLPVSETPLADLARHEAGGAPAAPPLSLLLATVPPSRPLLFDVKDESPAALALLVEAALASGRGNLAFGLHRVESLQRARALGWTGDVLGLLQDMDETRAFFAHGGTVLRLWEGRALAEPDRLRAHVDAGQPVWITTGGCDGRKAGDHADESLLRLAELGASGFLVNDPAACRAALACPEGPRA